MAGWNWPNFNLFISETWGWPPEVSGPGFIGASNIVVGCNPPYSASDFLSMYPVFGGAPQILSGTITQGSAVVTGLSTTAGVLPGQPVPPVIPIAPGQYLAGAFPDGTTVLSVDSFSQLTMTQAATANENVVAVYTDLFVPIGVLNAYIALASASLVYNRWFDAWSMAMGLYVAHFCILYLRAFGNPVGSAGQLVGQAIARGIQTSKSAGPVSVGIQPATSGSGLESWADFTSTEPGIQFARMAKIYGAGPMLVY